MVTYTTPEFDADGNEFVLANEEVLMQLRHKCNAAPRFTRQRDHFEVWEAPDFGIVQCWT